MARVAKADERAAKETERCFVDRSVVGAVREWLEGFAGIENGRLNVDFLSEEAGEFSIYVLPVESIIRRYMSGTTIRQFDFVIAMRAPWGEDVRCQMDNIGFFEWLQEWIEQMSRTGALPTLGDGRQALRVKVNSSGYAFAPDGELAQYQMQCKLVYRQEAGTKSKE